MEPNIIEVDTFTAGWYTRNHPFYICTLLRMLNFNPQTDKALVSTKDLTVKVFHNVEKKSRVRFDSLSEKNFNRIKKHYIRAGYRMAEFGYRDGDGWYIVLIKKS